MFLLINLSHTPTPLMINIMCCLLYSRLFFFFFCMNTWPTMHHNRPCIQHILATPIFRLPLFFFSKAISEIKKNDSCKTSIHYLCIRSWHIMTLFSSVHHFFKWWCSSFTSLSISFSFLFFKYTPLPHFRSLDFLSTSAFPHLRKV